MELPVPIPLLMSGLELLLVLGGPLLAGLLGVGLIVGALQTATQINDPAISFVPRALALVLTLLVAGEWAFEMLTVFFRSAVAGVLGGA